MKAIRLFLLPVLLLISTIVLSQGQIDSVKFFEDESIIEATLEFDMRALLSKKELEHFIPANISMKFQDSTSISEKIQVAVRGKFRLENCYMPGLKLNFHNPTSPRLYKLDKLKMVCGCNSGNDPEQLIIREYLVYKMYNLFTDKSLRTRLMKVTYKDASGRKKPYTQYAFLIEDIDEMAKRNGMKEVQGTMYLTELTDRAQMTIVGLFQYMIGNTDWSVPNYHNIKLMGPKNDARVKPIAVPYDFDICGFVDPPYATVDEQLSIENVRDRLYRGFPRTMEELQSSIKIFIEKKPLIYALIENFPLLDNKSRRWATSYLDDFFRNINSEKMIQVTFIQGARTQ